MLPLINRTSQSYGRSMMQSSDIVEHAKKHGLPVAALTDVHSLSALPEFLLQCHQAGIHGIAGVTLQVVDGHGYVGDMVLLGKGGKGFAALRDLIEKVGYVGLDDSFNPKRGVSLDTLLNGELKPLLQHCVMLDGFPGSLGDALIRRESDAPDVASVKALLDNTQSNLSRLRAQFVDGDYLAVQTPGTKSPLAGVLSMPPGGLHQSGDEAHPKYVLESTLGYAKDAAQAKQTMQWFKNYAEPYLMTLGTEEKVDAMLRLKFGHATLDAGTPYAPDSPIFLGADYLISRCATPRIFKAQPEGLPLKGKMDAPPLAQIVDEAWARYAPGLSAADQTKYRARLDEELDVIQSCRFEDYFVNIYKIQQIAKTDGNALMLRGSAVASLIMHIMGLSPVDPIKERLLFARFMSRGRIEDPDVDIELANPSSVLRAISETAEPGQLARLSSDKGISKPLILLTMARDALVRFYDLNEVQREQVQKDFERYAAPLMRFEGGAGKAKRKSPKWARTLSEWMARNWVSAGAGEKTKTRSALIGLAKNFNVPGLTSGLSQGSVVFIPDGVRRYFNVLSSLKNNVVEGDAGRIPQNKYNLLPTGHIKYDLLPNRSFTRAIHVLDAVGVPRDAPVDLNDPAVALVFERDAFVGVNQVSGYVGSKQAKLFRPRNFNELTAINALIRDGSASTEGAVEQYLRAKNDPGSVVLDAPVAPILGETYGCLLYEEQLLLLLTDVGGFSWQDADRFRSSLKKGKDGVIDQYERPFIEQAMARFGVDEKTASKWYQPLRDKRGRFVFNKAHAVAYAHLAVRQCWIKFHYPANYAAEACMDEKASYLDDDVSMSMAVQDWKNLFREDLSNPQNAQDFVKAIGAILRREEKNRDSGYRRYLPKVREDLLAVINAGELDFAIPQGVDRGRLIDYTTRMFARLEELGYQPLKHEKRAGARRTTAAAGPSSPANASASASASPGTAMAQSDLPVSPDAEPVNRRQGMIKWSDVMITQMLVFLRDAGVVKHLSIEENTATLDRSKFQVESPDGKSHPFHIVSPTAFRPTTQDKKRKAHSGMHQDRNNEPTNVLLLAAEIANIAKLPKVPYAALLRGDNGGLTFSDPEWLKFSKAFSVYCKNSPHALYDVEATGIQQAAEPREPTSPIMDGLFSGQLKAATQKAFDMFESGRSVSLEGLKPLFQAGHITLAQVRSEKPNARKNGMRPVFLEVFANYAEVSDKVPLYQLPLMQKNCLSPGGHQRFMVENVDPKKYAAARQQEQSAGLPVKPKLHATKKVGKIDQGSTTRGVRALVHGQVTPGAQTLWLTEAALDTWSFNELQREIAALNQRTGQHLPVAEENTISVKSAGFATRMIEEMLSVSLQPINGGTELDFCQVQVKRQVLPFTADEAETVRGWFLNRTIHFMSDDLPENVDTRKRLHALFVAVGMTDEQMKSVMKVHQADPKKNFNQNVNKIYDEFVLNDNNSFLHQSNFDTWLRSSGLAISPDGAGKFVAGMDRRDVVKGRFFSQMSPDEQAKVKAHLKAKFEYMTGAQSLGLALDNDLRKDNQPGAGLVDAINVKRFCTAIDVPVGELMPPERADVVFALQGQAERHDLKDHNDYLTVYKRLRHAGQHGEADALLVEYANYQIPPVILSPPDPELTRSLKMGMKPSPG